MEQPWTCSPPSHHLLGTSVLIPWLVMNSLIIQIVVWTGCELWDLRTPWEGSIADREPPALPRRVVLSAHIVLEGGAHALDPYGNMFEPRCSHSCHSLPGSQAHYVLFKAMIPWAVTPLLFHSWAFLFFKKTFVLFSSIPLGVMGWVHDCCHPQNCLALRLYSESFNGALMSGAKWRLSWVFTTCLKGQSGLVIGCCDALRALPQFVL